MNDDSEWAHKRVPERVYFSREFKKLGDPTRPKARFVHAVFPSKERLELTVNGEVTISKPWGVQQLKVMFLTDDRSIDHLLIQRFSPTSHKMKAEVSLRGPELRQFLSVLQLIEESEFDGENRVRIDVDDLKNFNVSREALTQVASENLGIIEEIARNAITRRDIVAIAYRRSVLQRFRSMLDDSEAFAAEKQRYGKESDEAVWQAFFEENQWIFGYGLFYVFASGIDDGKLERAVEGFSVAGGGKRADALLRTRGTVNSLCIVEIKKPVTELLEGSEYRGEVWAPSREVTRAVAQVQRTVDAAEQRIGRRLDILESDGAPTGEIAFAYRPRSILVVGNLSEFVGQHGVNEKKFSSFELYRRQLVAPEIVTFDELYERAKFVVETSDEENTGQRLPEVETQFGDTSDDEIPF